MGYSFGGYQAPRIAAFEQALRRRRGVRRDALEHLRLGGRQQGAARGRSAHQLHLDLPVPLGGRRAGQRDRARMGEEVHARGRRAEHRMRVPGPARRERPHRAARGSEEALREGRLASASTSRFSPPRKAAPSIARSTIASSASTTSATGCWPTCRRDRSMSSVLHRAGASAGLGDPSCDADGLPGQSGIDCA